MAGRIISLRFFSFKATHPDFVYVEELHAKVPTRGGRASGRGDVGEGDQDYTPLVSPVTA
eukprot:SAG22_NODE_493_length_9820_cov_53.085588_12_plen_60_part_00